MAKKRLIYVKSNKPWFACHAEKDGWCYGLLLKRYTNGEVDVRTRYDWVVQSSSKDWKRVALKHIPNITFLELATK